MSLKHLALVYLVCVIWGFNFIAVSTGLLALPPWLFSSLRFTLVLLLLLPFIKVPERSQWLRLAAICCFNGALHFGFLFWALHRAEDVSSVAILLQTYVPMTTLMGVFVLGESIGWRRLLAVSFAFGGVLVISFDPGVLAQFDAVMLALIAAFFLALGTMLMRRLRSVDALSFQAWTAVFSLPLVMPLMFIFEADQLSSIVQTSWIHWGAVIYSAVAASIAGHGLLFYLVQRHPVSQVAPHLLVAPLLAVLFGVLIWGDEPGWRLLVGGCMILGGVLVVSLRARARGVALDVGAVGDQGS